MGEEECESLPLDQPKKSRHRKKHLYNSILQQMEFYFGDSNLTKDRFLFQLLSENPQIDIQIFLKFNKIRKLNCTLDDIRKAISKSELIGVTEDGCKIFRKKPCKVKENVDYCTIYVENIKADANHESLSQIFSDFGKVVYVSIPKYKHNKANKGFAFIEYETEGEANEAIAFFDSIGCKIPSEKSPEDLQSILTFQPEDVETELTQTDSKDYSEEATIKGVFKSKKLNNEEPDNEVVVKKRKAKDSEADFVAKDKAQSVKGDDKRKRPDIEDSDNSVVNKKQKMECETQKTMLSEIEEAKKKKKSKKDKRKAYIKELGMQVLSKKEWKKLRNRYLDLQRKKMKLFKQYLNKQRFGPKPYEGIDEETEVHQEFEQPAVQEEAKLIFTPGVIVKLRLPEACVDVKTLKNEIKSVSSEVKYVDIPLPAGSEEVFVRFSTNEAAVEFCSHEFKGEKTILQGDEEKTYWEKIQTDRTVKFQKLAKKQRGRDKLLKRAERESAKHMRFDENE